MSKFETIDLKNFAIDANTLNELPLSMIEKYQVIPIKKEKNVILFATDSDNVELQSILESETGHPVKFVYSNINDIKACYIITNKDQDHFGALEEPDYAEFQTIHAVAEQRTIDPNVLSNLPDIPKIPDLVDLILYHAISHTASDIHIDPGPASIFIRVRIDGIYMFSNSYHSPSYHH